MTRRILKYSLITLGCILVTLIALSFTSLPFWTWYRMSTKHAGIHRPPDVIVVLGGGGMPSESGLMRCWYAARAANHFNRARVIIALPGNRNDSLSSIRKMKKEVMLRGVDADRILLEDSGTNTRAQAIRIFTSPVTRNASILVVTSPEHLYRAVLTFKKAGFTRVDGLPAFEEAIESDITFNDRMLGGRKWLPPIGQNITVRYQFWTQLHYEQLVIREWMAVVYYKLKGWI